ncbi:TPA: glycosyltransferase family 2 protein [Klebsiella pneumoniae]|uniref:glycosyltransferase family 2 protein n=1 Tax=Klebsiella pneumoniae TaxID=573 RepID=UPI001CA4DFD2|nr:glycosyltransferase [Klebsiella pneumoniae]MBW5636745.1 glycosyltransferase [Klebsiella pneumoniae]HCE0935490.1 glycosyltransferase [Klebsiella pneumoniae]
MSTPLVSVILPAFNAEMFLRESISSILNQSLKNIELVIINDGSTDSTEDIIKSFSDNRIVYLKNTINLGIIKTLNKGIDNAKGKYIARMDADDISMPNRLKRQIEVLENDESIDIVNIKAYILNDSGTFYTKNKGSFAASSNTMRYLQYLRNMIMHPGVMVKKDIMQHFKYRDSEEVLHIEDYDLWLRLFNAGYKCFTIDDELLYYRFNPNSISRTKQNEQHNRLIALSAKNIKNDFSFEFSVNSLKYNWGEFDSFKYFSLDRFHKELRAFFDKINQDGSLGPSDMAVFEEFISFKMLAVLISFIKLGGIRGKIIAASFLLRNMNIIPRLFLLTNIFSKKKKFIN